MPPRRKLPDDTIRYFEEWVHGGADPGSGDVAAGEEDVDLSEVPTPSPSIGLSAHNQSQKPAVQDVG